MTSEQSAREQLLGILVSEVVGPALGRDAGLDEIPTSRYTAAVLFPVGTEFSDDPPVSGIADEEPVSQAGRYYPSACGLSFILGADRDIMIEVGAATYRRPKKDEKGSAGFEDVKWERNARFIAEPQVLELSVAEGVTERAVLGDRARLVVRARPVEDGLAVTVALANSVDARNLEAAPGKRHASRPAVAAECLFETRLSIHVPRSIIGFSPGSAGLLDEEDEDLAFLYRDQPVYAVGHGVAADWQVGADGITLEASFVPRTLVRAIRFDSPRTAALAGSLDIAALASHAEPATLVEPLVDAYQRWVEEQYASGAGPGLSDRQLESARRIVARQREAVQRMRDGVLLLRSDAVAAEAFRTANQIMLEQMRRPARQGSAPVRPSWRAFQLAFALMVMPSLCDPARDDRDLVDLLWFPTGGGKTEAYLLLAAFEIVRRRLAAQGDDDGVAVLSRYTLRLLTTQQFQRAAAMICAAELIRAQTPSTLGRKRITAGLWLGGDHTPNSFRQVMETWLDRWLNQGASLPTPDCPWCGTRIVRSASVHGIVASATSLKLVCRNEHCPFSTGDGLPIHIVDEGIYAERPSVVIATVDKLALLPAWERPRVRLLGGPGEPGPSLVLQDELHLLAGPLGTTAALYEIAIDGAIRAGVGGRPKLIASTATIRRAGEQSKALFGRDLALFPPNGVRPLDSFFAEADHDDSTARLYVGVMTVGVSWQTTAVHTLTALAQGVLELPEDSRDPYWTSVVYANTIDDHGRVSTLVSDDVPSRMAHVAPAEDMVRPFTAVEELRGAADSAALTRILGRMEEPYGSADCLDCVITTNLIQVGIDVQRLGLMAIVGQPKGVSEYIQASSRVGRSRGGPGLIVTMFNHSRARDRSHYESFRSFHDSLYRWVEPISITPFSMAAMDRLLKPVFAGLVRHGYDLSMQSPEAAGRFRASDGAAQYAVDTIASRAAITDPEDGDLARQEAERLAREWEDAAVQANGGTLIYSGGGRGFRQLLRVRDDEKGLWVAPTSMRFVEPEVRVLVWEPK